MDIGLMGGIIGGIFGVAGGIFGTYFSIRNTAGPKERSFMIRMAACTWIAVTLFLLGLFLIPKPYNWLMWIPYGILLPLGIRWSNLHQQQIRTEEAKTPGPKPGTPE